MATELNGHGGGDFFKSLNGCFKKSERPQQTVRRVNPVGEPQSGDAHDDLWSENLIYLFIYKFESLSAQNCCSFSS